MLPAPLTITESYLASVRQLEDQLRSIETSEAAGKLKLTKVLSMADAEQAARSGPLLAALPLSARLEGMRHAMPVFSGALLTAASKDEPTRWLRIMLRSREQSSAEAKSELVDEVNRTVTQFTQTPEWQQHFSSAPPAAEVTGYYVMLGRLVSNVLSDQWLCFLLATVGILIVTTIATRSLRQAAAALVPNALPVFLVLGGMGWLGMSVNMGAAMIAAVSMGLSIDSSIHYLSHMRRLVIGGKNEVKAMRSAQENVGLALVLATAALIAGFMSLCFSQFVPTIVFGLLVTLTMLGGLIGNLIVLPLLISRK
jgi:predicted RND superfamily exporter protein